MMVIVQKEMAFVDDKSGNLLLECSIRDIAASTRLMHSKEHSKKYPKIERGLI